MNLKILYKCHSFFRTKASWRKYCFISITNADCCLTCSFTLSIPAERVQILLKRSSSWSGMGISSFQNRSRSTCWMTDPRIAVSSLAYQAALGSGLHDDQVFRGNENTVIRFIEMLEGLPLLSRRIPPWPFSIFFHMIFNVIILHAFSWFTARNIAYQYPAYKTNGISHEIE